MRPWAESANAWIAFAAPLNMLATSGSGTPAGGNNFIAEPAKVFLGPADANSMKITITIDTDNEAFGESAGEEVSRILSELQFKVRDWPGANFFTMGLRDLNGNKVGECKASR